MIYRTQDIKNQYYGQKHIKVCDKWNDFMLFYFDMFESYKEHCDKYGEKDTTIDRIDYEGDYEPSNCRWATNKTQANNKSTNRYITINNETRTLKQWCEKLNLNYQTVCQRLNHYHWNIKEALELNNLEVNIDE